MFIKEYMGYSEYFLEARHTYDGDLTSLDKFYLQCAVAPKVSDLGPGYMSHVNELAAKAKSYFDSRDIKDEKFPLAIRYPKPIETLGPELENIAKATLPWFEKNVYGCNLFVDKVYLYRNPVVTTPRQDSWLWHYDNNPKEIMKLLIYLNDVGADNAPLEFCTHKDGTVPVIASTRFGEASWKKGKRNTRLTSQEVDRWVEMGCKRVLVTGDKGTLTAFIPNVIHRANPAKKGYRDALFVRVRPTIEPTATYTSKKWSTSFEVSGVVPMNPARKA